MLSDHDTATGTDQNPPEPNWRRDPARPAVSLGVRAAILAGLVVATAGGGLAAPEPHDEPVRLISGGSSTCCPPNWPAADPGADPEAAEPAVTL
ncbi:hypothetical protein [Micromonospora cathayae]|uniref:Uncharacterized protein n=1 Tax=Micromonospora cathayae TaxID=3028804 RepID=A0ABY7ZLN2_9ACTN|nr:hypothetical protein [Micromonospora sp. HUAS 3]WDZ83886.1 hypothetical protein PVK37_25995 [Micromonospora sp. HUAS 3]